MTTFERTSFLLALGLGACGSDSSRDTSNTAGSLPTSITTDPTSNTSGVATGTGMLTGGEAASTSTSTSTSTSSGDATTVDSGPATSSTTGPACEGLECQIDECGGDPSKTRLRGIVFAPEGTLPLYNITVYVPNAPLSPLPEGVQCDTCVGKSLDGDPIVATITNTKGEFVLEGVPAGPEIPLVVSVGKWRREAKVSVTACADNLASYDATRLPRSKAEGNIPRIALTTGSADPLECLLRKVGIDDAEFTPETGEGRVHLYQGVGGTDRYVQGLNGGVDFTPSPVLWDSLDNLKKYDVVLMACEAGENPGNKPQSSRQAIFDYAGLGGRLFFTHFHNVWIHSGIDPWPTVAVFNGHPDLANPITAKIDTSFPKGQALADWMLHVGGSQVAGEMSVVQAQHTIDAVNTATRWIYTDKPTSVQYLTFNAPVGVPEDMQCGRVVDSDIHVSSGDQVGPDFPSGCVTKELSPQEKALVFMLFELSACLIPDDQDPIPG